MENVSAKSRNINLFYIHLICIFLLNVLSLPTSIQINSNPVTKFDSFSVMHSKKSLYPSAFIYLNNMQKVFATDFGRYKKVKLLNSELKKK